MPRSRQNNNLRERLLVEGYDAFLHNGYHGTGLKEVLDWLRIPKGSFYNYFESKEAFGVAVIRYYADCLDQKLTSALKGSPDPLAGLRLFFERLMTEFERANYTGGCLVANLGGVRGSEGVSRGARHPSWGGVTTSARCSARHRHRVWCAPICRPKPSRTCSSTPGRVLSSV